MSQVVQGILRTVRTGILEGLASGTSWDVLSSPRACWDHRTVRGNPGHLCADYGLRNSLPIWTGFTLSMGV